MSEQTGNSQQSGIRSGVRSAIGTMTSGGRWLRQAVWTWPIIAILILGTFGWILRGVVEARLKEDLAEQLTALVDADVAALKLWMHAQEVSAQSIAADPDVLALSEKLIEVGDKPGVTQLELLQAPALAELRQELEPVLAVHHSNGFVLVNTKLLVVASKVNEVIGLDVSADEQTYLMTKVLAGECIVSAPRKSRAMLADKDGKLRSGVPTMFAWAPLRDSAGKIVGAFGMRLQPETKFRSILAIGQVGKTGETYAFDRNGLLVSDSRFDDELHRAGVLAESEDSILNLQLRDPGVNMLTGKRPEQRRAEQPLTRMAAAATAGEPGVDVDGYRNYAGADVVGAWRWLPHYELGVVFEQSASEAFAVLSVLRTVFWSLFALLAAASVAIFFFTKSLVRLDREAREAALEAKQLGQYTLDEKLGEGGMGVVYRAHHAMLRRPTAIKFLNLDKTNNLTVARFEREVQQTAKLTHPNTISIYDYGRTPEGIFYYAMEYLEGINLEKLVERDGPLPPGRVINILRQVCGSLSEAHGIGLVHRDIKPANIIVTVRGGIYDFVKVLDFGLVKATNEQQETQLTTVGALAGTPLYMSPESINEPERVDARSDLYAVGAVGYFLLAGVPVFEGRYVMEICHKHINEAPQPPSQRAKRTVTPELEGLILECLAKFPEQRPASAAVLVEALNNFALFEPWNQPEAEHWWSQYRAGQPVASSPPSRGTHDETLDQTVLHTKSGSEMETEK